MSFSVLPQSLPLPQLCHTSRTRSCFPPPLPVLSPFLSCLPGLPAAQEGGIAVRLGSCSGALVDGQQGIPPDLVSPFPYPVGMPCSLCLSRTLKIKSTQGLLEERQDSWCHNHLTPVTQGMRITGFVQLHFQNFCGSSGNKWMFGHCVQMNDWKGWLCCEK